MDERFWIGDDGYASYEEFAAAVAQGRDCLRHPETCYLSGWRVLQVWGISEQKAYGDDHGSRDAGTGLLLPVRDMDAPIFRVLTP